MAYKRSPNRFPGRRFPLAQVFPGAEWWVAEWRYAGTRQITLVGVKGGVVIHAPGTGWEGAGWARIGFRMRDQPNWRIEQVLARQAAARITRILKAEGRSA